MNKFFQRTRQTTKRDKELEITILTRSKEERKKKNQLSTLGNGFRVTRNMSHVGKCLSTCYQRATNFYLPSSDNMSNVLLEEARIYIYKNSKIMAQLILHATWVAYSRVLNNPSFYICLYRIAIFIILPSFTIDNCFYQFQTFLRKILFSSEKKNPNSNK